MGKFLDRMKNSGNNREEWDEQFVDWDEVPTELQSVDSDEYEGDFEYEDAEYYAEEEYESEYNEVEEEYEPEEAEYYEAEEEYEPEEAEYYEAEEEYEPEEAEYYESEEVYEAEDDSVYIDMQALEDAAALEEEDEAEYYEDEAYYEDVEYYEEDDVYYQDGYEEQYEEEPSKGILAWFANMTAMDKITLVAGVCVLLLAIVTGVVFLTSGRGKDVTTVFASVGTQLDGIDIVGDKGLLALEDAAKAKLEEESEQSEEKDYGEVDYNKDVTVSLKTVSVQKDLKIKFVNQSSEKLISNVPFSVSVTDPNGKAETWSDDDMDGIIHKKGITPGNYKLDVNELSGDKYTGYTIPTSSVSAQVRKDIAYEKVDVSDEVKKESEIDTDTEEQKRQNNVESGLEDTVEWVESTQVVNTYIEVPKSKIADPSGIAKSGNFMRMAGEVTLDRTSAELTVDGPELVLTATYSDPDNVVSESWSSSDGSVAEVDADGVVTPVSVGTATITFTVTALEGDEEITCSADCEVTVVSAAGQMEGKISVDTTSVSLVEDGTATVQASVSGFDNDKTIKYKVSSEDEGIAEATVNKSGKVTITAVSSGETTVIVSANYEDDPVENAPTAEISVTVNEKGSISLDKTAATVSKGSTVTVKVSANDNATLSAKSSDEDVATVKMEGKSVKITGVKEGTATITVTAKNGDQKATATCAVTVKGDLKNDTTTKLKDNEGNQLYVQEGDTYREAVYADYYKEGIKFFKKGEIKYTGWQTIDGKVYFFDKYGKKVTGEQVIQGARYVFDSDGVLQTGSGVMGIDVSKHNGTIDWEAVKKSGVSYVIIRCGYRGYTQGSLVIDSKFEQNIKGATNAGLKVGVYFFSQAVDEVEAVEEASFVLDAVKNYKISYPIFLDVEYSGAAGNKGRADNLSKSARTAVCKAFCETIRSGGYTAGVYANRTWLESMIDPGQLSSHKIWLAQYAATPSYTGRYDMWQYTCTGKVSGISGNVDLNLSYMGY